MADNNELLIRISADAENAKKAFDDIKDKSEDLTSVLNSTAKIAAVGFAAFAAEIGLSVHAFAEAEAASRSLAQALQTQGLITEKVTVTTEAGETQVLSITEAYKLYAEQVQELTGIDDDAITSAQALAQGYLGNTKITKELTLAIADLSTKYGGDLNAAAEAIGRTIGTQTNAFARQGLVISDTASKAERMATVLEFVQGRFNGAAEAANQGLGSIRGLATAFGNLQEAIGERFAPIATQAISILTKLITTVSKNEELVNFGVALLAAGAAVTALATAIPLAAGAFITLKAALAAAQISLTGTQIAVRGLIGATGIGLLVIAVTELALHWDTIFPRLQAVFFAFVNGITNASRALATVFDGVMSGSLDRIEEGFKQFSEAVKTGVQDATKELPKIVEKSEAEQDEVRGAAAAKRNAREEAEAARRKNLRDQENELVRLQLTNASQEQIDLKTKEIAVLKQLETEKNAETIALLQARREQILALEDEQRAQDLERSAAYREEDLAAQAELDQFDIQQKQVLRDQDTQALQAKLLTDKEVERKIAIDVQTDRIKSRNLELEEKKKYGVAVAIIDTAIRSSEVQAAKGASSELIALSQSKNATLKAIGKAAAISSILINTAASAVTLTKQIQDVIPFPFSIPVQIALVGARIAFGAEQVANVNAAAEGGIVKGGALGRDSTLMALTPGELVVPEPLVPSFLDIVGQNALDAKAPGAAPESETSIQVNIQGDFLGDNAYIDRLIMGISDALQYRNAKLVGPNGALA